MTNRIVLLILVFVIAAMPLSLHAQDAQTSTLRNSQPTTDTDWQSATGLAGNDNFGGMFQTVPTDAPIYEQKSKSKAFFYSLLLPGLGHAYVGDKQGAKTFFIIEAAIWTSFIFFEVQGYIREENYQDYAQVFAGVSGTNKSDDYYSLIGQYDSWVDYEAYLKNEGRFALYPDADSQTLDEYFIDNRVSDYEPWVWRSVDERRTFRGNRSDSKLSYRRALYAVAVAMGNRAAAAFFSLGATNNANEKLDGNSIGYGLEFGAPVDHPGDDFETGVSFIATF